LGYASVFTNKQTQAVYATTDGGLTWQETGSVQAPVGDYIAADPTDPQDVVLLTAEVPSRTYTLQRSYDGGRTWQPQETTLPSTGMVIRIGWSGSAFLVGFNLDPQPAAGAALVAFPAKQQSFHLDDNGKINNMSFTRFQVLTGNGATVQISGTTAANPNSLVGLSSPDLGKMWTQLDYTAAGQTLLPIAVTDDGNTLLAITAECTQAYVSTDGGHSWGSRTSLGTDQVRLDDDVFIAPDGEAFVHVSGDTGHGTYVISHGQLSKVTAKDVVAISTDAAGHTSKLWTYDNQQGQVIWRTR
jgi:hypothetical protein